MFGICLDASQRNNKGGKVPQYGLGGFLRKVVGGVSDAFQAVADPIGDVLNPVFDAAGNIIDPALNVAGDIGSAAGEMVTDLADTAITGGLEGIKTLGHDVAIPITRGVLEPVSDLLGGLLGTKGGSDGARAVETGDINRMTKSQSPTETVLSGIKRNTSIANLKTDEKQKIKKDGDWVGDKENPFVTKNVEEELDYAAQGMKYMYEDGGKQDTVPSNQQFGNPQGLYGPPPKEEVGFFGQLLDQIGKEVNDAGTYMSEEFPWDVYRTLERAEKAGIPVLSRDFTKLKKKLEDGWLSTRDAVTKGATTVWDKNMEVKKTVDDALENAWLTTRDSVSDFLGFDEGGKMAETYKNPKYNKGGTDLFKNYKAQKMKKGGKYVPEGTVNWKDSNINNKTISDMYQDMYPDGINFAPRAPRNPYAEQMTRILRDPSYTPEHNISFAPRNRTNEMAKQMSQTLMAKGGKFEPHMMYDPKTGKGYMANKLQDHLDMKKKGYDHRKRNPENYPKAKAGMKRRYTNGGRF